MATRDFLPSVDGPTDFRERGGVAFATTRWSVVLTAQTDSPAAVQALDKLCATYWWPLYSFVRRQSYSPEDAQDLVQGFFARLLERRDLDSVRRERGRLRSYLLASLKNFVANARERAGTIKRGQGHALMSLDELRERERGEAELASTVSADRIYERRWAATLLEEVLARLEKEYRTAGHTTLFERLRQMLSDESGRPSQAMVAMEMEMTENAVAQAFYRFRQRYRAVLREAIADTVAMPGDIEDELRHLVTVLRE